MLISLTEKGRHMAGCRVWHQEACMHFDKSIAELQIEPENQGV